MRLYLDGVLDPGQLTDQATSIRIGAAQLVCDGGIDRFFYGRLRGLYRSTMPDISHPVEDD
jgi:hypothetical protein